MGVQRHRLDDCQHAGAYTIRTYCHRNGGGAFQIEKSGFVLCRKTSPHGGFYLGGQAEEFDEMGRRLDVRVGADLTGDGIPCVVITEFSGQLPRTYRDYIFKLGDVPRLIGCIDSGRNPLIYTRDQEGGFDIVLKNRLPDTEEFDSHWLGGIDQVTFSYMNGYYCPNLPADSPPGVTRDGVSQLAARIRGQFTPNPGKHAFPSAILEDAVDVMAYAGCEDLALELIEGAWPTQVPGKENYRRQVLAFFSAAPDTESASAPDTLCSRVPETLSRRFKTEPMRR